MSHRGGGSQSKASKTEKKGEGKGRETTPLVTTEIVPGRLNESEWSLLLDRDEGQDFAAEVVAEVVDTVIGITYDAYLDIAVIPYTVDHFHALLEEIVEAQFPICDEGEPLMPGSEIDAIISHPEFAFPNMEDEEESPVQAKEENANDIYIAEAVEADDDAAAATTEVDLEQMEITVMDSSLPIQESESQQQQQQQQPEVDKASKSGSRTGSAAAVSRSQSATSQQQQHRASASAMMQDSAIEGDVSWLEDEEPVCGITDSWAQGSVPVQKTGQTASRPLSRISVILEEEDVGMDEGLQEGTETERRTGTPIGQVMKENEVKIKGEAQIPGEDGKSDNFKKCPWERSARKQATKSKAKKKDLGSMTTITATEGAEGQAAPLDAAFLSSTSSLLSLEAPLLPRYSGAIVRTQYGRPPGHKDIAYDELGNVISVARIDPDKMPNHHVKTKFKVASLQEEPDSSSSSSPRRRPVSLKPSRLPSISSSTLLPTPPSIPPMPTIDDIVFPLATSQIGFTPADTADESGKTMIDRIEVSPGVIVKDNDRIKVGPEISSPDTSAFTRLNDTLQPIKTHLPSTLAIKDMVERRTPTLRPYHEKPLFTHYGRAK